MLHVVLALSCLAGATGCGSVQFFDRFTGEPVRQRDVAAPPDILWERLAQQVGALNLIVESVEPESRLIQFGWLTAPGDGRLYLDCDGASRVGSASFRPRVRVIAAEGGSAVIVSTETRTTTRADCVSTGRFESWLLQRLRPAMVAAAAAASATAADGGVARDR